jgi:hypothetical protein
VLKVGAFSPGCFAPVAKPVHMGVINRFLLVRSSSSAPAGSVVARGRGCPAFDGEETCAFHFPTPPGSNSPLPCLDADILLIDCKNIDCTIR